MFSIVVCAQISKTDPSHEDSEPSASFVLEQNTKHAQQDTNNIGDLGGVVFAHDIIPKAQPVSVRELLLFLAHKLCVFAELVRFGSVELIDV